MDVDKMEVNRMNQVILVGTVVEIRENSVMLRVDDMSVFEIWMNSSMLDNLNEFSPELVAIKGYLCQSENGIEIYAEKLATM